MHVVVSERGGPAALLSLSSSSTDTRWRAARFFDKMRVEGGEGFK
jgi:hypothetical protein